MSQSQKLSDKEILDGMNEHREKLKQILDQIAKGGQEMNYFLSRGMTPQKYFSSLSIAAGILKQKAEYPEKLIFILGIVSAAGAMCFELLHALDQEFSEAEQKTAKEKCFVCTKDLTPDQDKEYLFGGSIIVHKSCMKGVPKPNA